jgi:hypothetical protein
MIANKTIRCAKRLTDSKNKVFMYYSIIFVCHENGIDN